LASIVIVALATPRILLVGLPKLPADLIEAALATDPDGTIVGVVPDAAELSPVNESTGANVLIVGCEHGELPDEMRKLIAWSMPPDAAVIPFDGSGVVLYVLRPQAVPLGDVSVTELIAAIRHSLNERPAG
jgi:hypothetical protein